MRRRTESGFALLMGLTVLVILTILGLSVMSQVGEDLTVVRNVRNSENALAIAEAGIAWGIDQVNGPPYQLQIDKAYDLLLQDGTGAYSPITDPNDEICTGLLDEQCTRWRELTTPGSPEDFPDAASSVGTFRVAYGDDIDDDDATSDPQTSFTDDRNELILIRALGTDAAGSRRLIEVAVTAGN